MSEYVSDVLRQRLREHFRECCAYCRTAERLTVALFEVEHITPRTRGGQTVFENLCYACPTCNRYKSDRTEFVDPVTEVAVELFHPHLHQWTDHFAWNDDATEIIGLTPTGRATIAALKMNRAQLKRVRSIWVAMDEHPPDL